MTSSNHQHPDFRKKFGDRLKSLRKSKGVTTSQVAEALEISRPTYTSWEVGTKFPRALMFKKLVEYYKTSEAYLMLSTDNSNPKSDLNHLLNSVETLTYKDKELTDPQIKALTTFLDKKLSENQINALTNLLDSLTVENQEEK